MLPALLRCVAVPRVPAGQGLAVIGRRCLHARCQVQRPAVGACASWRVPATGRALLATRLGAASGAAAGCWAGLSSSSAVQSEEPSRDGSGTSRLLAAAYVGDVRMVQALVAGGVADVNDSDADGWSALLLASSQGHSRLVSALVELGADVEFRLDGDCAPLHMASISGHSDSVTILVRDGGARVDERSADGKTALMIAAANGHDDTVTALLDLGADIEAKDKNGAHSALAHETSTQAALTIVCLCRRSTLIACRQTQAPHDGSAADAARSMPGARKRLLWA